MIVWVRVSDPDMSSAARQLLENLRIVILSEVVVHEAHDYAVEGPRACKRRHRPIEEFPSLLEELVKSGVLAPRQGQGEKGLQLPRGFREPR
jgi:hypothetical protein